MVTLLEWMFHFSPLRHRRLVESGVSVPRQLWTATVGGIPSNFPPHHALAPSAASAAGIIDGSLERCALDVYLKEV